MPPCYSCPGDESLLTMRRSTGHEIRGGFYALCLMTVFFYYLCQCDMAVENDILRYLESHMMGGQDSQLTRTLWNENNLPFSFRSALVGPEQRRLRANPQSNLQRLTSFISTRPEEQEHEWSKEPASSSLLSAPGPIPALEVIPTGVSKSQAIIWNSGKLLRAIRGYHQ